MIKSLDQFVKPRDGIVEVIPDAERQKNAKNFSELVNDMLLVHSRHVETTKYTRFPNTSSLMLTYPIENDRRLHIVVSSTQTETNSVDSKKSIFVRETDNENRSYRWHSYLLTPGNHDVIRSDYFATEEELMTPLEDEFDEEYFDDDFDDYEDSDEAREREEELNEAILNSPIIQDMRLNAQFEEQMGVNYLAADADEIEKLREIVSLADFIHQ